jgi:stage III sporulation protein AD
MTISDVFKMTGIGVVGAVLALTLRKQRPELALLVSAATGLIIFVWVLTGVGPALRAMQDIAESLDQSADFFAGGAQGDRHRAHRPVFLPGLPGRGEESIAQKIELAARW